MFWNVITAFELAQLSTIKLRLAILTVELLTVQTSRYYAESSIYCIRNHDRASSSMCCSGQVTSYLLHPDLGQRTKAEDRVGVRSGRLSSQTQLKSRTLLENVTKSNLSLHKALQFASFIPLSVVGPPPPPLGRNGAHRSWTNPQDYHDLYSYSCDFWVKQQKRDFQ